MHSAPAVSFPVGRSRFQALLASLGWLASASACAYWCYQVDHLGWRQWLVLAIDGGVGILAAHAWHSALPGVLRWDGQVWWHESEGASVSGVLTVHLDVQSCLLLRLRDALGAAHWFWPEQRNAPASWAALRRAAYSSANAVARREQGGDSMRPDQASA